MKDLFDLLVSFTTMFVMSVLLNMTLNQEPMASLWGAFNVAALANHEPKF